MGPIKSNFYHELLVELSCDKSEATKIGLQWCLIPFNTRGWIATAPFWLALAELETLGLQLRQAKQSQHFRVCFYFRSENSAIFENSSTPRTMNWYGLAHFAHSMSKEHRADFLPHTGKQHKEMKWMPPPLYTTLNVLWKENCRVSIVPRILTQNPVTEGMVFEKYQSICSLTHVASNNQKNFDQKLLFQ